MDITKSMTPLHINAPCYRDRDTDVVCIVRARRFLPISIILGELKGLGYGKLWIKVGTRMTDAEAETLAEMKVCDLVDLTKPI